MIVPVGFQLLSTTTAPRKSNTAVPTTATIGGQGNDEAGIESLTWVFARCTSCSVDDLVLEPADDVREARQGRAGPCRQRRHAQGARRRLGRFLDHGDEVIDQSCGRPTVGSPGGDPEAGEPHGGEHEHGGAVPVVGQRVLYRKPDECQRAEKVEQPEDRNGRSSPSARPYPEIEHATGRRARHHPIEPRRGRQARKGRSLDVEGDARSILGIIDVDPVGRARPQHAGGAEISLQRRKSSGKGLQDCVLRSGRVKTEWARPRMARPQGRPRHPGAGVRWRGDRNCMREGLGRRSRQLRKPGERPPGQHQPPGRRHEQHREHDDHRWVVQERSADQQHRRTATITRTAPMSHQFGTASFAGRSGAVIPQWSH